MTEVGFADERAHAPPSVLVVGGPPMTLIAASAVIDGHIYVGADSAELSQDDGTGEWLVEPVTKMQLISGTHVMWGWSGSGVVGTPFGWWMVDQRPRDWDSLILAVASQMRALSVAASLANDNKHGWETTVVLAGFLDHEPRVVVCDQSAIPVDRTSDGTFQGLGRAGASLGWTHLRDVLHLNAVRDFQAWMETVAQCTPGLGPPGRVWDITATSCEEITGGT